MNKEEKLAYAKLHYPPGTIYYCKHNQYDATVGPSANFSVYDHMVTDGCGGAVWSHDQWAEVKSYPQGYIPISRYQINNTFPIY